MSEHDDLVEAPLVWVCSACGKRSPSRSGYDSAGKRIAIDRGWDSSCFIHAVLCEPNPEHETDPAAPKWLAVKPPPSAA